MTMLRRKDFRFVHRLRVRWAEVDMQKIVFNAHYLMYFDTAIADYWRALALPYESAMAQLEGDLYVRKATVDYLGSARVDDQLDVAIRCQHIGRSSILFSGAIFRADAHLISCELVYVFADPRTQKSRPVPEVLRAILAGYEAREPMVRIEVGPWAILREGASQVRAEVFEQEQGIAAEMASDEADLGAVHALARNRLGQPVATARLLQHAPGVGRVGRLAVNRVLRGSHLGRDVLRALLEVAAMRGDHEVCLLAQRRAEEFYVLQGFQPRGEPFEEAGISHIEMAMPLFKAAAPESSD
ncbi:YbgC/FadM family acyl-CoA thioesterase [Rhodoferax sp.]|uniref:YbgC/FadM family acyl-CoA thioesterase n=1 Tax=Rhodoferax sp. TaxID=50421 RepID=UPI00275EA58E|nr:YbgC/FadM family acyl-CoA thioesterase [Rhodoferax sp.]